MMVDLDLMQVHLSPAPQTPPDERKTANGAATHALAPPQ